MTKVIKCCKVGVKVNAFTLFIWLVMNIKEKIDISILNSIYGNLLTPHQREMVRLYYDCDISLFEISEQFGISRQAVRDALLRAEKSLIEYEDKLGLLAKNKCLLALLTDIISSTNDNNIKEKVSKVIDKLEE